MAESDTITNDLAERLVSALAEQYRVLEPLGPGGERRSSDSVWLGVRPLFDPLRTDAMVFRHPRSRRTRG